MFATSGIDQKWVSDFGDRTLNSLIKEGKVSNLSLQAMSERLNQSKLKVKATRSQGLPQVGFGSNGTRQKTRFLGLNIPGLSTSTYNSYNLSINTNWELDLWGRIKAARNADLSALEADYWNINDATASLAGQISKAYFAVLESQQQENLAKRALKTREEIKDAVKVRFASALTTEGGSATQLRLALSDIASAKTDLAQWQEESINAKRRLELLLGRYPSADLNAQKPLPNLSKRLPSKLPSELLLRRPDLRAAESRYTQSVYKNDEAARAIFPSISLTSSIGTTSTQLRDLLKSSFGIWSLGGAVTQSILSGGAVKAEKLARKSEAQARLVDLHDAVLKAFGEVEQSLTTEHFLRVKLKETKEAEKLAKDAYKSALTDYKQGLSDIQTVLNSEARVVQNSSRLITFSQMLLNNRVDLYLALGGDFTL